MKRFFFGSLCWLNLMMVFMCIGVCKVTAFIYNFSMEVVLYSLQKDTEFYKKACGENE